MLKKILSVTIFFESSIILVLLFKSNLQEIKTLSEIFQAFSIGIGALLGGFGGLRFAQDSIEKQRAVDKIKKLREKYPINKYGIDFYLVNRASDPGTIYIFEKKDRILRHVANPGTLQDLYLSAFVRDMVLLPDKKFSKIKRENPINTRTIY